MGGLVAAGPVKIQQTHISTFSPMAIEGVSVCGERCESTVGSLKSQNDNKNHTLVNSLADVHLWRLDLH